MPDNHQPALDDRLFDLFNKLVPLIDNIADAMRTICLFGFVILVWFFVWMYYLQSFSLTSALIFVGLASLPVLVLSRFWWALSSLKNLPDIAGDLVDDVTDEVKTQWKALNGTEKSQVNIIGQVSNLWQLRSLLSELDDIFAQSFSLGILMNPLSLLLGVLSLLSLFLFFVIALGLLIAVVL
ncbi:MAG: hypothetical protein ACWA5U_03290 [bacterium]